MQVKHQKQTLMLWNALQVKRQFNVLYLILNLQEGTNDSELRVDISQIVFFQKLLNCCHATILKITRFIRESGILPLLPLYCQYYCQYNFLWGSRTADYCVWHVVWRNQSAWSSQCFQASPGETVICPGGKWWCRPLRCQVDMQTGVGP